MRGRVIGRGRYNVRQDKAKREIMTKKTVNTDTYKMKINTQAHTHTQFIVTGVVVMMMMAK